MKKYFFFFFFFLPILLFGQDNNTIIASDASVYISKYKNLAMLEQVRIGMPAAVILAQGIYESQSGKSLLAIEGNNHFGIKCKKDWKGETILHDDDAKQECFRKYTSAKESYLDHSNYLKNNNRYAFLFDLNMLDYKGWAVGLRKAGYATNPAYSALLIAIIEKYNLQNYTKEKLNKNEIANEEKIQENNKVITDNPIIEKKETVNIKKVVLKDKLKKVNKRLPASKISSNDRIITKKQSEIVPENDAIILAQKPKTVKVETYNNIKGFKAKKGDNLSLQAEILNVNYKKLLQNNDLKDELLKENMFIYLDKKPKVAIRKFHILQDGETLIGVAQKEGIQLNSLRWLNLLYKNDVPVVGTRLHLQEQVENAPDLVEASNTKNEIVSKNNNKIVDKIDEVAQPEIAVENENRIIEKQIVEEKVEQIIETAPAPIDYPQSPSTYDEPGLSNEIKNLKRQMDVMVYAPPPVAKAKKVILDTVKKITKSSEKNSTNLTTKSVKDNSKTKNNDAKAAIIPAKITVKKKETIKKVDKKTKEKEVKKEQKKSIVAKPAKPAKVKKEIKKKTDDE